MPSSSSQTSTNSSNSEPHPSSQSAASDVSSDCTANCTDLFNSREVTQIDMSLHVADLEKEFIVQSNKNLAQLPPSPPGPLNDTHDLAPYCDDSHVTYITQNQSSFQNTTTNTTLDQSRDDFPRFGEAMLLPSTAIILDEKPPLKTPTLVPSCGDKDTNIMNFSGEFLVF